MDVTVKTGTARATTANHLIDTTDNPFTSADVGRAVWNTTDDTYAVITNYNSTSDVTLDTDIMANGEGYKVYASRYTATVAGVYIITILGAIIGVADGKTAGVKIRRNGATIASLQPVMAAAASTFAGSALATYYLSIGDYIEGYFWQTDTSALTAGDNSNQCNLCITKIT
jgi:hypothetical protein